MAAAAPLAIFRQALRTGFFAWGLLILSAIGVRAAAPPNAAPDFLEVFGLVRAHLAGVTEAELNHAAVEGLLARLRGRVLLVAETNPPATPASSPVLSKVSVIEDEIALLRVSRVEEGLAGALSAAYQALSASNTLKGIVLDLRFADGEDFATAATVADLFVAKERPLLDWGRGLVKSTVKDNAMTLPVAALINRETTGAAEALAAVLREAGAGLLLGSPTAGAGMVLRDYPLKDGGSLRIASGVVKLGDGTALPARGVPPDIEVVVKLEEERVFMRDAYGPATKDVTGPAAISNATALAGANGTNRRSRVTEADLVRQRREGRSLEDFTPVREREPLKPRIHDPALARAVDLLQGLAVLRGPRS